MCLETMDTTSKHFKTSGLRKTTKQGPKLRWGLLRVSTEDEAFKQCRASVMKATIRKYLHQQQRRTRLAKVSKILTDIYEKEKLDSVYLESPAAACVQRRHPGAMAPENTTQYLMSNVYEDMETHTQPAELPYEASAQLYAAHWMVPARQGAPLKTLLGAAQRNESNAPLSSGLATDCETQVTLPGQMTRL